MCVEKAQCEELVSGRAGHRVVENLVLCLKKKVENTFLRPESLSKAVLTCRQYLCIYAGFVTLVCLVMYFGQLR